MPELFIVGVVGSFAAVVYIVYVVLSSFSDIRQRRRMKARESELAAQGVEPSGASLVCGLVVHKKTGRFSMFHKKSAEWYKRLL